MQLNETKSYSPSQKNGVSFFASYGFVRLARWPRCGGKNAVWTMALSSYDFVCSLLPSAPPLDSDESWPRKYRSLIEGEALDSICLPRRRPSRCTPNKASNIKSPIFTALATAPALLEDCCFNADCSPASPRLFLQCIAVRTRSPIVASPPKAPSTAFMFRFPPTGAYFPRRALPPLLVEEAHDHPSEFWREESHDHPDRIDPPDDLSWGLMRCRLVVEPERAEWSESSSGPLCRG